jgi:hypothetical protein
MKRLLAQAQKPLLRFAEYFKNMNMNMNASAKFLQF